jgi:AAA family ATP:ADP antiporter
MSAESTPTAGPAGHGSGGGIYRLLRIFTVIYPGEATKALLLFLNVFLLMFSYYIIKPVRDALILTGQSAEIKAYMGAAQAVLLIFVVKAFSRVASRFPRHILIAWVTLFFISNLVLFYVVDLFGAPVSVMGIIFFIWIGIYNQLIPAQFWGFANDLYSEDEGKRLFPLIAYGATLGSLVGSIVSRQLWKPVGAYGMMLVTAAVLGVCIFLSMGIHKREVHRQARAAGGEGKPAGPSVQEQPLKAGGGFRLVFKSRYLFYIAIVIAIYNFVNQVGEYILGKVLQGMAQKAVPAALDPQAAEQMKETYIGQFYSGYQFLTNVVAMIIALFLVSRLFRWVGVAGALFVFPLMVLGGYGLITLGASLLVVKWVKIVENGTDYSLMNATKAALYLITSREEKYKAKVAIDTFFVRGGDFLGGLLVFIGTTFLAFRAVENYAIINAVSILVWVVLCFFIVKEYKKRKAAMAGEQPSGTASAGSAAKV